MGLGDDSVRRRAPRVAVSVTGRLSGRTARPVTVLDLSLTGCLARCAAPLRPGAIFDLELALPQTPLLAKVQVAEASQDGAATEAGEPSYLVGLQFMTLPAHEHDRLRRFLDEERRRRRSADAPAR